jgi:FkbM family methyltransferase
MKKWIREYSLEVRGVIHVGAHLVQERFFYQNEGYEPVCWLEAIPEIASASAELLKDFRKQRIINSALWSINDANLIMNVTDGEGSSSSLLDLHLHKSVHPNVTLNRKIQVTTSTLDSQNLDMNLYNTLVLDTQGAELEILKGSTKSLTAIDQIVCEVSIRELYKNAPMVAEISGFLKSQGFELAAAEINRTVGWGDALFIRAEKLQPFDNGKINSNIKYFGKRFTLGILIRTLLIRFGLYERVVKIVGKR